MEPFFDCIEQKIIQLLETSKFTITEELEETGTRVYDHLIVDKIDEAIHLLQCRINRSEDRCSTRDCIRKASKFDAIGEPRCKYH